MLRRECVIFGRNVGNVLGQIRSFGEAGIKSHIIWYGEMSEPVRNSKYVIDFVEVNSEEEGFKLLIEKFGDNPNKNILSTDNDGLVSLFDMYYDELKDRFFFFNAGSKGRLTHHMTKMNQCQLAKQCGLKVPDSEVVKVGQMPTKVRYPIFTKSLDSFDFDWKSSVSICKTESELQEYYSKRNPETEVLLQDYIVKENEYILQGISINGGEEMYLPIEGGYYRLPKDAYGSYLFFNSYRGGDNLKCKLQEFFKEIGYTGVFEVEFLQTADGDLYFLEVNFRHTLWNHTFTDMGLNFCTIWANSVINNQLIVGDSKIQKEPHTLMREFQDYFRCRADGSQNFIGWLKELKKTDSFVIWDKRDKKPFFIYIFSMIFRILKNRLK